MSTTSRENLCDSTIDGIRMLRQLDQPECRVVRSDALSEMAREDRDFFRCALCEDMAPYQLQIYYQQLVKYKLI